MSWEPYTDAILGLLLAVTGLVAAVAMYIRARATKVMADAAAGEKNAKAATERATAARLSEQTRLLAAEAAKIEAEADRAREETTGRHLTQALDVATSARSDVAAAQARIVELEELQRRDHEVCRRELERANAAGLAALDRAERAEARANDLEAKLAALRAEFERHRDLDRTRR